jgi:ABC-type branched-subunit amino acid transport system permease subunit
VLAANTDRAESDLTRMPAESAELWQAVPGQAEQAAGTAPSQPDRRDLWTGLIVAAVLAAAVELYLGSRALRLEGTT